MLVRPHQLQGREGFVELAVAAQEGYGLEPGMEAPGVGEIRIVEKNIELDCMLSITQENAEQLGF